MNPIAVESRDRTDIYNGIKEAYRAGGVPERAREYFFLQMQAATRYNSESVGERWLGFGKEYLAGYGVRPFRVLTAMAGILLLSSVLFSFAVGAADGILLAAGGLFTFGARAELLTQLNPFYRAVYIATAFAGISLTALFITVMANVSFREQ